MKNEMLCRELNETRQLEEAAQMEFNRAKNRLIKIRRKRMALEKLLRPPGN